MPEIPEKIDAPSQNEKINTTLMWMHITWLPLSCLPAYIIWRLLKNKHPQVDTHGKNILNAFSTLFFILVLSMFSFTCIMIALISFGFVNGEVHWATAPLGAAVTYHHSSPLPFIILLTFLLCMYIYVITSSVTVGLAAKRGETLSYWWAIRFCKNKHSQEPEV